MLTDWLHQSSYQLNGWRHGLAFTRSPHLANFPSLHSGSINTELSWSIVFLLFSGWLKWTSCFHSTSSNIRHHPTDLLYTLKGKELRKNLPQSSNDQRTVCAQTARLSVNTDGFTIVSSGILDLPGSSNCLTQIITTGFIYIPQHWIHEYVT